LRYAAGQVVSGRWELGVLVEPDAVPGAAAGDAPADG
jgi:hypothetical protein